MIRSLTESTVYGYGAMLNNSYTMYEMIYALRGVLINTSTGYRGLVENLTQLHSMVYGVRETLIQLDTGYRGFRESATMMYSTIRTINESMAGLNTAVYNIHAMYPLLFYNVTHAFYYLAYATDAYSTGSIDQNDLATVIYYTNMSSLGPVNPGIVNIVFTSTYLVVGSNPDLVTDDMLANIMARIMINMFDTTPGLEDEEKQVMEEVTASYARTFIEALAVNETNNWRLVIGMYTTNTSLAGESRDKALWFIESVSSRTLSSFTEPLSRIVLESMESMGVPASENLSRLIAAEAIWLGPTPSSEELEDAAVNATLAALAEYGAPLPPFIHSLYRNGVTQGVISSYYSKMVMLEASSYPPPMNETIMACLPKVLELDPGANGTLASNETLLRSATIDVVVGVLKASGAPEAMASVIPELYDMGEAVNETAIEHIAKRLMSEMITGMIESGAMPMQLPVNLTEQQHTKLAEALVSVVARVDLGDETSVYNGVRDLVLGLMGNYTSQISGEALEELFDTLYSLGPNATTDEVREAVSTLYMVLDSLVKEGLLESREEYRGRIRRIKHRVTERGLKVLRMTLGTILEIMYQILSRLEELNKRLKTVKPGLRVLTPEDIRREIEVLRRVRELVNERIVFLEKN